MLKTDKPTKIIDPLLKLNLTYRKTYVFHHNWIQIFVCLILIARSRRPLERFELLKQCCNGFCNPSDRNSSPPLLFGQELQ